MSKRPRRRRKQQMEFEEHQELYEEEPITFYQTKKKNREPLRALTEQQGQYISSIKTKDITFGVGPAGTGKTYIATMMAADALLEKKIEQITISRPMVACGEDMGFLPGREDEKYAPWIEPIMDVLEERIGTSQLRMYLKNGRIKLKPLMFMRGKTHRNSWVILDEAQNTTPEQMKMFLTRIGDGSKMIINGDISQSDIVDRYGKPKPNGLTVALDKLSLISRIGMIEFTREDIVRHGLVAEILRAYEE